MFKLVINPVNSTSLSFPHPFITTNQKGCKPGGTAMNHYGLAGKSVGSPLHKHCYHRSRRHNFVVIIARREQTFVQIISCNLYSRIDVQKIIVILLHFLFPGFAIFKRPNLRKRLSLHYHQIHFFNYIASWD